MGARTYATLPRKSMTALRAASLVRDGQEYAPVRVVADNIPSPRQTGHSGRVHTATLVRLCRSGELPHFHLRRGGKRFLYVDWAAALKRLLVIDVPDQEPEPEPRPRLPAEPPRMEGGR